MSDLEDTGPQTGWGGRTMKIYLSKLERKILKNNAALEKADEHVRTIAELKVVFKWLKVLAVIVTTCAGVVIALKTLGVF